MRYSLKGLAFAAALATAAVVHAPAAEAAFVGPAVLTGAGGSGNLDIANGDVGVVIGLIEGSGVSFTHTLAFTAGGPTGAASGVSVTLDGIIGIAGLMYSLNGGAFATAPSAITGSLVAGPLANTLTITGVTSGSFGGNYKADIAVTPIPAALGLLGAALAGLGIMGYRRRA